MLYSFGVLRTRLFAIAAVSLLSACVSFGQQSYVTRYDLYTGYAYFNSPHVSLQENGFHIQAGVRATTWLTVGVDYSRATGDLTLTPDLLLPAIQNTLGTQLHQLAAAGMLPAGYTLAVPAHSVTQTITGGPVLAYRHWKLVTLFVRPDLGFILETATPQVSASDPIAAGIVKQLAPTGSKHDRTMFYGFGGGFDVNFSKHVAFKIQADFVRDHLFDDLLTDSRNTVRFSCGPVFNFGKNIVD